MPPESYEDRIQAPTNAGGQSGGMGRNGLGYIERFYDSGLTLPDYLDRKMITTHEVDRISRALSIVTLAGLIPRRLGAEATGADLALDKKRARRVGHALTQSVRSWQQRDSKLPLDDSIRLAAVHMDWQAFRPAHLTEAQARMRLIATWAIRVEDTRWGRSAIVKLENEVKWVDYALRDL